MSSFFDEASLVMIPSGYKDQKVYSVKPLDGSGDLTFSRASSATRVASNGLIEKVRTNLALSSNNISTQSTYWRANQSGVTVQNSAVAPDGTTTAALITPNGIGTFSGVAGASTITLAAGLHTFSAYLKTNSGTASVTLLVLDSASTFHQVVVTATTTWTRFSVSFNAAAGAAEYFITSGGSAAWLAWGAQVETGDITTDLIATTTTAVSVGPVSGLPRLDYLNSTCPRLLLEPQRSNVLQYSEQFDNAYWTKSSLTVTANNTTSPDGNQSADKLAGSDLYRQADVTAGTLYAFSVFLKKSGTSTSVELRLRDTNLEANIARATVNLDNGTVTNLAGSGAYATNYGNGWYRLTVFGTPSGNNTLQVIILPNTEVFAWGAQLEAGAYATSYIPTLGTSVTRVADAASKTGISSLIGQTAGTIYAEWTATNANTSGRILAISDGGFTNRIAILEDSATIRLFISASSVTQADLTNLGSYTGTHKIAVAYANNDLKVYLDGVAVATATTLTVPACSSVYVGTLEDGSNTTALNGGIKQALLFPTRLSNSDLAALTA